MVIKNWMFWQLKGTDGNCLRKSISKADIVSFFQVLWKNQKDSWIISVYTTQKISIYLKMATLQQIK